MRKDRANSRVFLRRVEEERGGGRKEPLKSVRRVVFTKNEEKMVGTTGSESARGSLRRLAVPAAAALFVWASVGAQEEGPTCPAPSNFKVCQDSYPQPLGRVFITWTNAASYDSLCILVDGRLDAELPGSADILSISGLDSGFHRFAIQGHCASLPSVLSEVEMEVLADPPPGDPVRSLHGGFDPEQGAFVVAIEELDPDFESVDIFVQLDGFPEFLKCQRLAAVPDQDLVILEITETTTRVFLQFFDKSCHGSANLEVLVLTPDPETSLGPPVGLQVFQTEYEKTSDLKRADVILCWVRHGGQKGFEVLVDGIPEKRTVGALVDTFFLTGLATGQHNFEVRMIPWEGVPLRGATARATLLPESPMPRPVRTIHTAFLPGSPLRCSGAARRGTLHVSWEPETSQIPIVDVFLQRGDAPLRSVITIDGEDTEIDLPDVFEDEDVALQFFDEGLFGSPVFGGGSFRRGDPNASDGVDISDAVMVLDYLFIGTETIDCLDAADANDDGKIDISDATF